MKKVILMIMATVSAMSLQAQNINPEGDYANQNNTATGTKCCSNMPLSGWCMDFNVMGGALNQQYTYNNPAAGYSSPVNTSIGSLNFDQGMSYGFEVQGGYFFGKKKHWGVGLGLMYMYQQGNLTLDNFHVEYQSIDNFGNTFRQLLTANNQITETLRTSSFNIPIVAKYQTMFSKKVGFTADAGLLFNLHVQNNYSSNASFDYEAIYQYQGTEGNITTAYDPSPVPAASDLLITKNQYLSSHPGSSIENYFSTLRGEGYNVALGQKPKSNTGNVSYMSGSAGLLIRPAISIYLCHNANLNLGVYYYYQAFTNTPSSNYRLTDKIGEYSSLLNSVTNATNNSYGVNVGVRYTFCKKQAPAPVEIAPEPEVIPTPEPEQEVASPEEPETPHVDISTPLLFDLNKTVIKESSIPILEEAVRELKENPKATLIIHGYTDNTGSADYNKKLSRKRANVVKNYLKQKGVDPKILKTMGHGSSNPTGNNKTKEGRMKNRRVIMRMRGGEDD